MEQQPIVDDNLDAHYKEAEASSYQQELEKELEAIARDAAEQAAVEQRREQVGVQPGQSVLGGQPATLAPTSITTEGVPPAVLQFPESQEAEVPFTKTERAIDTGLPPEINSIIQGVRDGVVNTMQQIHSLGNWMRAKGIGPKGVLYVHVPNVNAPDTVTGALLQKTSQFLTGFIPGMKAAGLFGITGRTLQSMTAGALADLSVFDPHEPRVSNALNNLSPEVLKPLTDFIMADPEDSKAEATFKQVLEGLALGGLVDGMVFVGRAMRAARQARRMAMESGVEELAGEASRGLDDIEFRPEPQDMASTKTQAGWNELSMSEEFEGISVRPVMSQANELLELQQFIRKHGGIRTTDEELAGEVTALVSPREVGTTGLMNNATGRSLQDMAQLAEEAGFTLSADKTELLEALDRSVRGQKVLSSMHPNALGQIGMDTPMQQAYRDFRDMALKYDELTEEMRAGERSLDIVADEAKALIDSKQFTLEDVRAIFPNQAMNDVQASAMLQSLTRLGVAGQKIAADYLTTESDDTFTNLLTAMGMLGELDPKRLGVRAANSRSLGVWRDPNRSFNEYLEQYRHIFDLAPRIQHGSTLTKKRFAEMVAGLKTPQQLAQMARHITANANKATMADVIQEAWISSLLSGPQTNVVNVLSAGLTTAWAVPERFLAATMGDLGVEEGVGMLYGAMRGMGYGLQLAKESWMTEGPVLGLSAVREARFDKAISAEALQLSGNVGQAVNYLGQAVRLMPRGLQAADEFFKGLNYTMELHAQAFRHAKALAEGDPDEMSRLLADFIANPPRQVHEAALDFGFYNTFTRDLMTENVPFESVGRASAKFSEALNELPMGRVIAPFVRTPVNIMRYSLERTPLGLLSRQIRRTITDPGPEGAMTRAKLAAGSLLMGYVASEAASGNISGRGPSDPALRKFMRDTTNWQPYSVRVRGVFAKALGLNDGDWVSYNRLDPIGQLFGFAADFSQIVGEVDDVTAARLAGAIVSSVWQNLSSKTYMQGMAEAVKVFAPDSWSDPERSVVPGERFVERLAGTAIPTMLAQVARAEDIGGDPVVRDVRAPGFVDGMLNQIYARVPGWSASLPPQRNFWGEEILRSAGLGPDLMSPLYTTNRTSDPVSDEIVRLGLPLRMPPRSFSYKDGARPLELTAAEYGQYVQLSNGIGVGKTTLKTALASLMSRDEYQRLSDGPHGGKALAIRKIINTYRNVARELLPLRNEELGRRIRERERRSQLQLIPEGPQRDQMEQQLNQAEQQLTIR